MIINLVDTLLFVSFTILTGIVGYLVILKD